MHDGHEQLARTDDVLDELVRQSLKSSGRDAVERVPEHVWVSMAGLFKDLVSAPLGGRPFHHGNDNPRLTTSVVAYVDALGTSEAMATLTDEDVARRRKALLEAQSWFDSEFEVEAMLTFSDNTVIASPIWRPVVPTDPSSTVGSMVGTIGAFQLELLLTDEVLYRGGIGLGLVFAEPGFITGQGLIDAINLEERQADVPRILLSNVCRDLMLATYILDGGGEDELLLVDGDGATFVNYLMTANDLANGGGRELVERHRDLIEGILADGAQGRPRLKHVWAAHYHDFACEMMGYDLSVRQGLTHAEAAVPRAFRTIDEVFEVGVET